MTSQLAVTTMLLLGLMFAGCRPAVGNPGEAAAIAAIQQLGGKVEVDDKQPDRPVLKVYLHSTPVTDADLAHLEQLKRVQNLFLGKTQITDAGLEHLQGASNLKTLSLNATRVTDVGLKSLTGLTNLKTLNLQETKVTAGGVAELKRKLPGVTIAR